MRLTALCGALCLLAVLTALVGRASAAQTTPNAGLVVQIGHYQQRTWRWQKLMGLRKTHSSFSPVRSTDPAYRGWVLRLWKQRAERFEREAQRWMAQRVRAYQADVAHWRRVMGAAPTRMPAAAGTSERDFLQWRALARQVRTQAQNPPYEAAWQCIHRYEGSWRDTGAPYYGGLQMDIGFQRAYGGYLLATKGTADRWTPLEQMWVAARAHRSGRGFTPWPHTARLCGLI